MDYIRFLPSADYQFDTLHLWPIVRPHGIHLVCCAHGGERIALHDAIRYAFAPIAKDARFHVFLKPNPCSSMPFLQSSSRRVNIVLSIDGIRTLVNVVIANPTQIDFGIMGSSFSWGSYNISGSSERRTLLRPLLSGHVSPFCHKSFWVSSPRDRQLSSSMW